MLGAGYCCVDVDAYLDWKLQALMKGFDAYIRELASIAEKGKPVLSVPAALLTLTGRDSDNPTISGVHQSEISESHHDCYVPFKCHSNDPTDHRRWTYLGPNNNHELVLVGLTRVQLCFGRL